MGRSTDSTPFMMLSSLYRDDVMSRIWSERSTIQTWLQVEAALARAQANHGVFPSETAEVLAAALDIERVDVGRLWRDTRNVGYPILPLIRQVGEGLPSEVAGRLHYGATTQDIMDTGMALQLVHSLARLRELVAQSGDALATLAHEHRATVMAARTHNQQAVPTTFGAKLASYVDEFARQLQRLDQLRERACRVSLFGAAGTSAALGPTALTVRAEMANLLGLRDATVSWHASRDALTEYVATCASLAHTAARLAREISNLSRTEVGEVLEPAGHHRGASSTMPQKANPVTSEVIIGMANVVRGLLAPSYAAMVVEHERATGEWHIEWDVIPYASTVTASALRLAAELVPGLRVDTERMAANLNLDGGLVLAEAYMIRLARQLGRGVAHDLVYEAVVEARATRRDLASVLAEIAPPEAWQQASLEGDIGPADYVGETEALVAGALEAWSRARGEAVT